MLQYSATGEMYTQTNRNMGSS